MPAVSGRQRFFAASARRRQVPGQSIVAETCQARSLRLKLSMMPRRYTRRLSSSLMTVVSTCQYSFGPPGIADRSAQASPRHAVRYRTARAERTGTARRVRPRPPWGLRPRPAFPLRRTLLSAQSPLLGTPIYDRTTQPDRLGGRGAPNVSPRGDLTMPRHLPCRGTTRALGGLNVLSARTTQDVGVNYRPEPRSDHPSTACSTPTMIVAAIQPKAKASPVFSLMICYSCPLGLVGCLHTLRWFPGIAPAGFLVRCL